MTHLRSTDSFEEIVSETGATGAILKLTNTVGGQRHFVSVATPEASITASIGDVCTDVVGGVQYLKKTGTSTNTGWSAVSTGGNQDAFMQTGNIFTLSFNEIRYASLGGNSLVALESLASLPQFAGVYNGLKLKVISNTLDGVTVVKLRKNATDAGPTISFAAATAGIFSDSTSTTVALDDLVNLAFNTAASGAGSITIAGILTRISSN